MHVDIKNAASYTTKAYKRTSINFQSISYSANYTFNYIFIKDESVLFVFVIYLFIQRKNTLKTIKQYEKQREKCVEPKNKNKQINKIANVIYFTRHPHPLFCLITTTSYVITRYSCILAQSYLNQRISRYACKSPFLI